MRLASISADGQSLYGAITDDGFIALSPIFRTGPAFAMCSTTTDSRP